MKSYRDLQDELRRIDGRGYKAYESIRGQYKFDRFVLSIDHVQGDPFAPPSTARVTVNQGDGKFPKELYDTRCKRIAAVDFLTRVFDENIRKYYSKVYGTGKSGVLSIDRGGQQMLDRTSVVIDEQKVEARIEVGLPAAGRTITGRPAEAIFIEALPKIVMNSLYYGNINGAALKRQVDLAVDQDYIRNHLDEKNLVAFISNGSILPRESGVSQRPMRDGAIPFKSPESMEVEFDLPNRGTVRGMGIRRGITLIVGGGYHGKSTLLRALELGVYNHIEGDGRELVICSGHGVKIRAEDGRRVEKVDISPFIKNLPSGQDTVRFSTENASGSTSQAANIMEALEAGARLLLIDEDTSATNFMVRDEKMQCLVERDREPITPFIDRVKGMYEHMGVSTILVAGSSGDYFDVADTVIMMDEYRARDVTARAKDIAYSRPYKGKESNERFNLPAARVVLRSGFANGGPRGAKIRAMGLDSILYDRSEIDLSYLEQLADKSQVNSIAYIIRYIADKCADGKAAIDEIISSVMEMIDEKGLDSISPLSGHPGNLALPRRFEIAAAINRFRYLNIK